MKPSIPALRIAGMFPRAYRCNSLVFRTSVLLRLLLDLDTSGGVDHLGVFPQFLKNVADIVTPKLSIIFRRFISLGITQGVIQYPANRNPAQSLQENAITVCGPRLYNSLPKYLRDIESVKT